MQRTLNFDALAPEGWNAPMPAGYGGLDWRGALIADTSPPFVDTGGYQSFGDYDDSGLAAVAAAASPLGVAYAPGGAASIRATDGEDFSLLSAWLGSAWNNGMKVRIIGWNDGVKVATRVVKLDRDDPQLVQFGAEFAAVDRVVIRAVGGTDADPGDDGAGPGFAIDALTIDLGPSGGDALFA